MSSNSTASPLPQSPPPSWGIQPQWDAEGNCLTPTGKSKSSRAASHHDEKEPFPVSPLHTATASGIKSPPSQDKRGQSAAPSKKPPVKKAQPKPKGGYDEEKQLYWQQQKALEQAKAASSIGPAQPQGGILALQESLCGDCECCACCEGFGDLLFHYGYYYIFDPLVDGMYKILSYFKFYPTNDAQRRAAGWFLNWYGQINSTPDIPENTPEDERGAMLIAHKQQIDLAIFEAFTALPPRALAAAKHAVVTRAIGGLKPYENREEKKGGPALSPQALQNLAFWNYVRANSIDLIIREALEQFSFTGRLHNDPLPVAEQQRLSVGEFLKWSNEGDRSQEESIARFSHLPQPALVAAKKAVERKRKDELDRFLIMERHKDPDTSDSVLRQRAFSTYVKEYGINFIIREALENFVG